MESICAKRLTWCTQRRIFYACFRMSGKLHFSLIYLDTTQNAKGTSCDFQGGPGFSTNCLPLQGSFGFGQKVFQEFLSTGPTKIMLLGPEEDSLAKSIAAYAGIPEVSLLQVHKLGNCAIVLVRLRPNSAGFHLQNKDFYCCAKWLLKESLRTTNQSTGKYCSIYFLWTVALMKVDRSHRKFRRQKTDGIKETFKKWSVIV